MPRRFRINYYNQYHCWVLDAQGQRKIHAIAGDFFARGGHALEIHDGYGDTVFTAGSREDLR